MACVPPLWTVYNEVDMKSTTNTERGDLMKNDMVISVMSERGISIRQCAKDIGISRPDLSSALNGRKPMYPKYRRLLSEYLGIAEEVLFPDDKRGADGND